MTKIPPQQITKTKLPKIKRPPKGQKIRDLPTIIGRNFGKGCHDPILDFLNDANLDFLNDPNLDFLFDPNLPLPNDPFDDFE